MSDRAEIWFGGFSTAGLPLGNLSREFLMRWRDRMMELGKVLKAALGLILVFTGPIIALGYDKVLETGLMNAPPAWLTDLTTRLWADGPCLSRDSLPVEIRRTAGVRLGSRRCPRRPAGER
ncbi:hypothetical protein ASF22_20910 [Methylobacterium sp. Leaf87]|nr:hypothetical protein ASF22_20910 [Methylobacterium sp. Leaf87]